MLSHNFQIKFNIFIIVSIIIYEPAMQILFLKIA
jgi:hypothetical protein